MHLTGDSYNKIPFEHGRLVDVGEVSGSNLYFFQTLSEIALISYGIRKHAGKRWWVCMDQTQQQTNIW